MEAAVVGTQVPSNIMLPRRRMVQKSLIIWVDGSVDRTNADCQNKLEKLQNVIADVNLCTTSNECIQLLNGMSDVKAFIISSGYLGQDLVPDIHRMPCVDTIFIFCGNKDRHETWAKNWPKIQGVFISMELLIESLKKVNRGCEHDAIPMSFVPKQHLGTATSSRENLKHLPPSFMFSVLFKEIILEIDEDEEKSIASLLMYCRQQKVSESELKRFQSEYHKHSLIWCYSAETFLYGMLNKALRSLDMEGMMKMGFIIRKLHQQLERLHKEQSITHEKQIIVYRGQGLIQEDLDSLSGTKGGLLSFNNFLSTSKDQKVAMEFVQQTLHKYEHKVGVLFIITIDSNAISSSITPFASIESDSALPQEQEILFSMHAVFRVDDIKPTLNNNRLWEAQLALTDENDSQLAALTQSLRKELFESTGWHRLGDLLIETGDFEKAEEVYLALLQNVSAEDEKEKSVLYHKLGLITYNMSKFREAEHYLQSARLIQEAILSENDPELAKTYNVIGAVCIKLGNNSEALRYFQKSSKINETLPNQNNHELAIIHKSIGTIYSILGKYTESLSFYNKAIEFNEKSGLTISPELASCYTDIGSVYLKMEQYEQALEFNIKALEMNEKTHAPHHRHIANSYSQIGSVYGCMGKFEEAFPYLQKALSILENSPHQSHLASCYRNFGLLYSKMEKYEDALSYFEKAASIFTYISPHHPKLGRTFIDIGVLHGKMKNYQNEQSSYERALDIFLSEDPPNYHGMAHSCCCLGMVYTTMKQYEMALTYSQRALEYGRMIFQEDDPVLQMYRENIEDIKNKL